MPDKHRIIIEIDDEEDEGVEYISQLIEMILLERLPEEMKFELYEYED